ncbi:MAG: wax ester/triacylglycerol synthase family O-acyltransferase [Candidatus Nanopelagicales bacterium]
MAQVDEDRMGAFDAVMWGVEDDPLLRSVIVVLVVLESPPDVPTGTARVERLTREVPALRQRVIGNPMSLVPPRWETDPNFDLSYHLRWVRAPRTDGTLRPVLDMAAQMAEQDFDRDRPLWEMTLVTGLDGDRAALLFKIHHSVTDGVGGMRIAASLFDFTPAPRDDLGPEPDVPALNVLDPIRRVLNGVEYETRTAVDQVRGAVDGGLDLVRKAVSDPVGTAGAATAFAASAGRLLAPAGTPLSPVMTGRSLSVRLDLLEYSLDDLKRAGKAVGGTLNDAFIAAVAGGLRSYHDYHGQTPQALRINMPVNLRSKDDSRAGGNAWVPARFPLPIDQEDAGARIKALHPLLKQARSEPALPISGQVFRVLATLPQPVTTAVAGGLMKGTDVAATNVPGPPFPVYLAGAKVLQLVPFAPKAGAAVNIGLMSYDGRAEIGINIDTQAVPDAERLVRYLDQAFGDVLAVGTPPSGESAAEAKLAAAEPAEAAAPKPAKKRAAKAGSGKSGGATGKKATRPRAAKPAAD